MFRRYTIAIKASDEAVQRLNAVNKLLGCSVSEPSNWVEYGSTKERGLTFLDKDGRELTSSVFLHQPCFSSMKDKKDNEIDEITQFVFNALNKLYPLTQDDVKIKVTEYSLH